MTAVVFKDTIKYTLYRFLLKNTNDILLLARIYIKFYYLNCIYNFT